MIQLKVYPNEGANNESAIFLDLYETQPIKLTLSIEDITNADATSVFSRTFKVPATRHNNEFFDNAFEIDGIDFDITIKKPAEIIVDGAEFKTGHVRLQKIFNNEDLDKIDYELLFLGETRDFSSAIGELTMCQLSLTDFNWDGLPVEYTNAADFIGVPEYSTVQQSWQAFPQGTTTSGLADGDLLYPLIDHGNIYTEGGQLATGFGTMTLSHAHNDGYQSFNFSENAISPGRFKPMIRAKRLWDQIFQNTGYTYESEFIDSEQFLHMYVSAFGNEENTNVNSEQSVAEVFEAFNGGSNGQNDVASYLYLPNIIFSDPSYVVNIPDTGSQSGGSYFVAPANASPSAYYSFEFGAQVDAQLENSDYGYSPINVTAQLCLVDAPGGNIISVLHQGNTTSDGNWSFGSYDSRTNNDTILAGQYFQIFIDPQISPDYSEVGQAYWHCNAAPGGNYQPMRDLDCDYQQIDFIKDIITMFRLVMQPSPSRPNHFIIEPWQDFIGSGEVYDWSSKLIREKDFISEPLFNTQSAVIEYTMQEDEDLINKFHQDNNKHAYGWLRFNSDNELLKGKRDIEVKGIAPTPIDQINSIPHSSFTPNPKFILPQIVEVTGENFQRLPIKPVTRFLFYNGLIQLPPTSDADQQWWFLNGATPTEQPYYPLVSPYEYWTIENIPYSPGPPEVEAVSTLNLNFANDTRYFLDPDPNDYDANGDPIPPVYNELPNTLFEQFWSRYISSLYNKYSRRVTAYFTLNNVDLQTLTFDDIIFIDGKYYRPEKIIDAQIGERTAVKCELITVKDQLVYWPNEVITNFSAIEIQPICAQDLGQIQVTTNGTPDFTWELAQSGLQGQVGGQPGAPSYTFIIDNVPPGIDTLTVTDANGRTAVVTIEIIASSLAPVTAAHTIVNATDCGIDGSPCNGEVAVTITSGNLTGATITWQDGGTGFTRTGLCPGDYMYYVTDGNGCQSEVYTAVVSCTIVTYRYQLRQHLNNCSQSSSATYIAESTTLYSNGQNVSLNEIGGCFYIQNQTTQTNQYTIANTYADCQACENATTPKASWKVENCDVAGDFEYLDLQSAVNIGDVVTLQDPGNTNCYEVIEQSTTPMDFDPNQVFASCAACNLSSGFDYRMSFCNGLYRPITFTSQIALTVGQIMEVDALTPIYGGMCVEVTSLTPGASQGNLDTTQFYDNCSECQGITQQVCHSITLTSLNPVTVDYIRNGQSIQDTFFQNANICAQVGSVVVTGSAIVGIGTSACITNIDCNPVGQLPVCVTLYGGQQGPTTFQYTDSSGQVQQVLVSPFVAQGVCAEPGTTSILFGFGNYTETTNTCLSANDCFGGPGIP